MFALRRRAHGVALLFAGLLCLPLAMPSPAAAVSVDQTCLMPLTRFDSGTLNVAFPDEAAQYWTGAFAGLPGSRIRLEGNFPHARYMSFNVYDPQLRPVDAIADRDIEPTPGSTNPFRPGADRTATDRSYTAYIETGAKPATPAANTVYTGDTNLLGAFIYRIYIPDQGRDEFGDVGLPRAFMELGGGVEQEIGLVDCSRVSKPSGDTLNDIFAELSPPPPFDVLSPGGTATPEFVKFVNLGVSVVGVILNGEDTGEIRDAIQGPLIDLGGSGGFVSNKDNAYVSAVTNRAHGQVLVVRARAPSFPDTRSGVATMPSNTNLRYFSMCQNEAASQRFIACRSDDQTVVNQDGFFTYVISTAEQRPENARADCGVTWMPWGPVARGVLIYRHMLPDPGFTQSIQASSFRLERLTMGDYLPTAGYLPTKDAFEARGCAGASGALPSVPPAVGAVATGRRAAALKRCAKKHRRSARRKCRRKARRLPV